MGFFLKLGGQSPTGSGGGQEGGRGPGTLLCFGDVHGEFLLQRNVPCGSPGPGPQLVIRKIFALHVLRSCCWAEPGK